MTDTFASQAETPATDEPQAQPNKDENKPDQGGVEIEVGDKRFSLEQIQTKVVNQDKHIATLESENASLREQLEEARTKAESMPSLEELMSKLERSKEAPNTPDKGVTPEEIEKLINSTLTKKQQEEMSKANHDECKKALIEKLGVESLQEALPHLKKTAEELGMSLEEVDQMASTRPQLFKRTFVGNTVENKRPNNSNPSGSFNTENYNKPPTPEREYKNPTSLRTDKERVANLQAVMEKRIKELQSQ